MEVGLEPRIRFVLRIAAVVTADPGYQQVLANGGGTTTLRENDARLRGNSTALGVDQDCNSR